MGVTWILHIEGLIYSFRYSIQGPYRTFKGIMTKFGFINSGKGEVIEGRFKGIKQLSNYATSSSSVYKCILFALMCQWTPKNDWNILSLQVFLLNVLNFDLHLWKQSIFRAIRLLSLRRGLWKKSHIYTSCYWCSNSCIAIFYRYLWSMNS